MSLRNTNSIYGVAIFTGHNTKVMMNSAKAKYKFSSLEKLLNSSVKIIFSIQCSLALIGDALGSYYEYNVHIPHDSDACKIEFKSGKNLSIGC